jgi:hypothetical protein
MAIVMRDTMEGASIVALNSVPNSLYVAVIVRHSATVIKFTYDKIYANTSIMNFDV